MLWGHFVKTTALKWMWALEVLRFTMLHNHHLYLSPEYFHYTGVSPHTLSSFSYFSFKCSPLKINILSLSLPSRYISNKCCKIYGLYVVSLLWHAFKVTHTVTLINILYIPHVGNLLLLCAGLFPPSHLSEHEQTVNYLFLLPIAVV